MSMTRKHYVEVAAVIKSTLDDLTTMYDEPTAEELLTARLAVSRVASGLASMLARDNRAFDWNRFMDAAGLGDPNGN